MAMGTRKRGGGRVAEPEESPLGRSPGEAGRAAVARLFDGVLRSARNHLCRAEQPLAAEVWASGLLSVWDGPPGGGGDDRAFGDALVRHARAAATPEAAAVLLALAAVAPPRLATKARTAAAGLVRRGLPTPAWAREVGQAAPTEAWVGSDTYGDQEILVTGFAYPGGGEHTICVLVDHNLGGIAKDAYPAAALSETLARWREAEAEGITLRPAALSEVAGRLDDALVATDFRHGASPRLAEVRALLTARLAALPTPERPGLVELDHEGREELVADFLSSPEATGLLAEPSVVVVCHSLVAYRCDYGDGDPLRWSPTLAGLCLLDHFPAKVSLDEPDLVLVPAVLAAWVGFAGRRRGLPEEAVARTVAAVEHCRGEFALAMLDESRFGPAKRVAMEMLAEGVDLGDESAVTDWLATSATRPTSAE